MLGCVLFTMAFYRHPFQDESPLAIANANYRIPEDQVHRFSSKITDMIHWTLSMDPTQRPTCKELLDILNNYKEVKEVQLPPAVRARVDAYRQRQAQTAALLGAPLSSMPVSAAPGRSASPMATRGSSSPKPKKSKDKEKLNKDKEKLSKAVHSIKHLGHHHHEHKGRSRRRGKSQRLGTSEPDEDDDEFPSLANETSKKGAGDDVFNGVSSADPFQCFVPNAMSDPVATSSSDSVQDTGTATGADWAKFDDKMDSKGGDRLTSSVSNTDDWVFQCAADDAVPIPRGGGNGAQPVTKSDNSVTATTSAVAAWTLDTSTLPNEWLIDTSSPQKRGGDSSHATGWLIDPSSPEKSDQHGNHAGSVDAQQVPNFHVQGWADQATHSEAIGRERPPSQVTQDSQNGHSIAAPSFNDEGPISRSSTVPEGWPVEHNEDEVLSILKSGDPQSQFMDHGNRSNSSIPDGWPV
eukprot:Selendium_serpulae@DN3394_c0_g1_i5.p1